MLGMLLFYPVCRPMFYSVHRGCAKGGRRENGGRSERGGQRDVADDRDGAASGKRRSARVRRSAGSSPSCLQGAIVGGFGCGVYRGVVVRRRFFGLGSLEAGGVLAGRGRRRRWVVLWRFFAVVWFNWTGVGRFDVVLSRSAAISFR